MRIESKNTTSRTFQAQPDRVDRYLRVLHALMLRDMRTRFTGTYWGYVVQVLWPVTHMFIIALALAFRKVPPPFGDSTLVFAATGAVPALAFQYISREMMKGIMANKPLTYYPQVKSLDVMFSRILVEIVGSFLGICIILFILVCAGLNPLPSNPSIAIAGYWCAICLGISIGTINCAIIQFFPGWMLGYMGVGILLYISSGVVFTPSELPEQAYYWLKFNPVLQVVEWVRLGYDPSAPVKIDYVYLFLWIAVSLSAGLLLERTVSRQGA